MKKDGGSGRMDGSGAYNKPTLGPGPHEGAVYAVAGSSGQISGGTLNHPAMFISLNNLGSMVLDVNGNTLDAKFLRENGAIVDYFRIVKGGVAPVVPAAPSNLVATTSPAARSIFRGLTTPTMRMALRLNNRRMGPRLHRSLCSAVTLCRTLLPDCRLPRRTFIVWRASTMPAIHSTQTPQTQLRQPRHPRVPAAPSGLTATAVSRTQINLSWVDNSGNETGFKIERCKNANCTNYVEVGQVGANVTTFADTGLTKNTTYRYRVRAFNAGGNSGYSNAVSAKNIQVMTTEHFHRKLILLLGVAICLTLHSFVCARSRGFARADSSDNGEDQTRSKKRSALSATR